VKWLIKVLKSLIDVDELSSPIGWDDEDLNVGPIRVGNWGVGDTY
jgi:hypothetical protein